MPAYRAIGVVRLCGVISRVGVAQYEDAPIGFSSLFGPNITLIGDRHRPAPTSKPSSPTYSKAPSTADESSTAKSTL